MDREAGTELGRDLCPSLGQLGGGKLPVAMMPKSPIAERLIEAAAEYAHRKQPQMTF